jgi:hypothetical protein
VFQCWVLDICQSTEQQRLQIILAYKYIADIGIRLLKVMEIMKWDYFTVLKAHRIVYFDIGFILQKWNVLKDKYCMVCRVSASVIIL